MSTDRYEKRQANPLYRFLERVWYLIKIHLAMLVGTVMGLGIFGFFPSLFAATELLDETLTEGEGYVFRPFLERWKQHFKQANLFGLGVYAALAAGFGIWYALWYLRQPQLAILANTLFILLGIAFVMVLFYYPVMQIIFKGWTWSKRLSYSILFGFGHFLTTLVLVGLTVLWILFVAFLPQYAIFVLFSILPYAAVRLVRHHLPKNN